MENLLLTLKNGELYSKDEVVFVEGNYYRKIEMEQLNIIFDHYYQKYVFDNDCYMYGVVGINSKYGYFNKDANYINTGDEWYISYEVMFDNGIDHCESCEIYYYFNHEDCNCDSNSRYCFDYHEKIRQDISNNSMYKIGLEVEKEDLYQLEKEYPEDLFYCTNWIKEEDGSLNEDGFELVSPVFPFDIEKNIFEQEIIINSINEVSDYINAEFTESCGGHINISCKNLTSRDLLFKISGYIPLLYSIYEKRVKNTFSEAKQLKLYNDRKLAFRLKELGVLEIRIFPAVKNVNNLLWRIELIRLFIKYSTNQYKVALHNISNPKHEIHQHLLKVFNKEQLLQKCKLFAGYLCSIDYIELNRKTINKSLVRINKAV